MNKLSHLKNKIMKKVITLSLSLCIIISASKAQVDTALINHKADPNMLLQKSKNKKKVAWIMAGGGATFILAGSIIPRGEIKRYNVIFPEYKNDGIKASFLLTGALSMLGSIPFFISSHHNKKKAASLSFRNERVQQINKSSLAYGTIPGVSLKFKL